MASSSRSPLFVAAAKGDVKFLERVYEENARDRRSYFLGCGGTNCRNFIHEAVESNCYASVFEVLRILKPEPELVVELICQAESDKGCNPLHLAAKGGNIFIVKLLVNAYNSAVSAYNQENQQIPPWLSKNSMEFTPVRCSLESEMKLQENIARYLVGIDEQMWKNSGRETYPHPCSTMILDRLRASILFRGMKRGFSLLVEQILNSNLSYTLDGASGESPLHYGHKCDERVSRLLLEKHPELIMKFSDAGESVLGKAVKEGAEWLVKLMLIGENHSYTRGCSWIKACRRLIWHIDQTSGDTPLHIAARMGHVEIAKLLIQGYQSSLRDEAVDLNAADEVQPGSYNLGVNPLYIENSNKNTPILLALKKKHDDCGVMLAVEMFPTVIASCDAALYKRALVIAAENECLQAAKTMLGRRSSHGLDTLHGQVKSIGISKECVLKIFGCVDAKYRVVSERLESEVFRNLLDILPRFLKEKGKDAKTHLKEAAERGEDWLVSLILESDRNLLNHSGPAWQVACEKGYISTLLAFIGQRNCDKFTKHCKKVKQTPFHHIKLLKYDQYMELLKRPELEVLKNQIDSDGATPLHCAILRDDLELTRALLECKGIDVSGIKNKNGKTALDLLENRCKFSNAWGKMCREIEQDSTVKGLKYLFRRISFEGMQNTLSVVAALVATISFAAGFAIPGGVNSSDGTAVLATKAAFLVFSVSNTIAMCSSIMVLVLLLGPMLWDPQPSLKYVNWSLILLLLSLGGTILAFMTGVFVMMVSKVMWDAKFVLSICSFTLLVACILLLTTYSSRFKNIVVKPFRWLKKVSTPSFSPPDNRQLSENTPTRPVCGNTDPSQQQSGSTSTSGTVPERPQSKQARQGSKPVPKEASDKGPDPSLLDKGQSSGKGPNTSQLDKGQPSGDTTTESPTEQRTGTVTKKEQQSSAPGKEPQSRSTDDHVIDMEKK